MEKGSGEVERRGVTGERKGRVVGGFVAIVLAAVVLVLILVIAYFALRREKTVPPSTQQPKTQSDVRTTAPCRYV